MTEVTITINAKTFRYHLADSDEVNDIFDCEEVEAEPDEEVGDAE